LARFREADLPALFRPEDFRPPDREDFRPLDRDDDFRALFRAELRPPRFEDLLDFLADRRALFLAPFRADLRPLLLRLAERLVDFLRAPPLRERLVPPVLRVGEGS